MNNTDLLIDSIRLRSSLTKWKIICFLIIFTSLCFFSSKSTNISNIDYIARISINDEIHEDIKQERIIRKLAKDKNIKALIVHINSPGGTEVGSENLFYAIKEVAKNKPVVGTLGTVAASGSYMAALACDQIFARHSSITGSIGVIIQFPQFTALAEKIGVNFITIKSAELKASPSPFENMTPKVKQVTEELLMDNYDLFVDMVAKNRKLTKEQTLALADGRIYNGKQALKHKLIDAIGGEVEAINWLETAKSIPHNLAVKDIALIDKKNKFETLLEPLMKSFSSIKSSYGALTKF
jgi:protease-4